MQTWLSKKIKAKCNSGQWAEAVVFGMEKALYLVKTAPTVERHGECKTCKHFVICEIDGKTHVCEHPEIQLEDYYDYACIMMEDNDFCSRYEPREKVGDGNERI